MKDIITPPGRIVWPEKELHTDEDAEYERRYMLVTPFDAERAARVTEYALQVSVELVRKFDETMLAQIYGRAERFHREYEKLLDQAAQTVIAERPSDHDRKHKSSLQTHKSPYENRKGKR